MNPPIAEAVPVQERDPTMTDTETVVVSSKNLDGGIWLIFQYHFWISFLDGGI